ncbi:hypothetical protein BJ508DRAFT_212702 [Ascobolus immersus RN42]|uniref:DDE Tnp4 domain-containing protein n=1 Tax=Ascobolus immersus RN42 TaxID=1160509 RepID=A0A3N4HUN2_ASCIM|nr:hypothetical protein BJ508DRAFT_212702 [Ascobolus immersus RN42]
MWTECGIDERLRDLFKEVDASDLLYLYGDPAYYPGYGIMGPFRPTLTRNLTSEEEAANILMSGERIVVEWAFGLVTKAWGFTAFKKVQKVGLSPVGAYYFCAVLFTNIQTCVRRRNQISDKYSCLPPVLELYLA